MQVPKPISSPWVLGKLISTYCALAAVFLWDLVSMVGLPGAAAVKNPPANAEDVDLILVSGRPPEGGNGNPLPFSCLENPGDRGAWWAESTGSH